MSGVLKCMLIHWWNLKVSSTQKLLYLATNQDFLINLEGKDININIDAFWLVG